MIKIPKVKLNKGIITVILIGLLMVIGVVIVSAISTGRGTSGGSFAVSSYKTTCEVTIDNQAVFLGFEDPHIINTNCHQEKVVFCTVNPMAFLWWGTTKGNLYMSIGGESQEIPFEVAKRKTATKRISVCHKTPDNQVILKLFAEEGDTVYDDERVVI